MHMKTPSNSMVYETVKQTTNHIATSNTATCQDEIDAEREPINSHRYFHPPSISSIKFQSRVATITQKEPQRETRHSRRKSKDLTDENTDKWFAITVAEKSLILKKAVSSWYIFATFIIQHAFIGYAWFHWSPYHGYNMSFITYWFYWILTMIQLIAYMYYPFYAEIVLNPEIPILNDNRKSLCLLKTCLIIEILHIFYLIIADVIIPSLCLLASFTSSNDDIWCPIDVELFLDSQNIWILVLILIALSFAFISIFVLIYLIHLDIKLYKIWQIHTDYDNKSLNINYRNRNHAISSPNIAHPELPDDDPYNLELQNSSSSEFKL